MRGNYEEIMHMTAKELQEQERRYRRWTWERRLRRVLPWLFWAAAAVATYWLAQLFLVFWRWGS